jgi:hypothetical protein
MTCVHLRQLYRLCQDHHLKLSGSDLIRVACTQCGEQEVCPNTLTDEYDARHGRDDSQDSTKSPPPESANSEAAEH